MLATFITHSLLDRRLRTFESVFNYVAIHLFLATLRFSVNDALF